jgi:hypothetical protein
MRVLVFTICVTVFALPAIAQKYNPQTRYYTYGSPVNDKLNIQKVELAAKSSKTLAQLLTQLPKEFRSRPVFMFASKSLHHATSDQPRIILSSLDASFLLAFPLDPLAKSAEMLQAQNAGFSLKEIKFDGRNPAQISESNSPKCLECHQSPHRANIDPRPNWEPYPRWGGALGQEDKKFTAANGEKSPEQENLIAKILEWKKGTDHAIVKLLDLKYVIEYEGGVAKTLGPLSLTHKLSYWNFRRVARLITKSSLYPLYKKEIASCMINQGYGEQAALSLLPPSLSKSLALPLPLFPFNFNRGIQGCLTRLFVAHGIDTTDWPMVFRSDEVLFDQFLTPRGSDMEFYSVLREFDSSLPEWKAQMERPEIESNFNLSEAESLLTNTALDREKLLSGETLLNRCTHCHMTRETGAPFINFRKDVLKESLKKGSYPRGNLFEEISYRISNHGDEQMPPRNHLKSYEQTALAGYLESLLH